MTANAEDDPPAQKPVEVSAVAGVPGATGVDGAAGEPGVTGVSAVTGVPGVSGVSGVTGVVSEPAPVDTPRRGTLWERTLAWLRGTSPDMKVGTLQYTGWGLLIMCMWLFWGDMVFTLSEHAPHTIALQLDRLGIPRGWMVYLMGTFGAIVNFFMVPVISFRSDRTRTRWGRRIPYILGTTIPVSLSLIALGFTDDIGAYIGGSGWPAFFGVSSITLITIVVGALIVIFDVSNVFINTCWWYLLRDVVPAKYMTRFMAVFALIGTFMGMIWSKYFYPYIETHVREIYIGAAALYFCGFTLMCLMVKEGEYPPPEPVDKRDPWRVRTWKAARLYFTQSFRHPLILMYFARDAIAVFTGAGGALLQLYLLRQLHFTLYDIGIYGFYQGAALLVIKLPIGWFLDRHVHPMKAVFYSQMLLLAGPFLFFWMGNYEIAGLTISAYMMWVGIHVYQIPIVQVGALSGFPLQTRLFPAAQFGQFGSANAMGKSAMAIIATLLAERFVAFVTEKFGGNYGLVYIYLWSGTFGLLSFVSACVLFRYWYLFGGPNFKLDLQTGSEGSGVSRAQLWRPVKIGAMFAAVIIGLGAWGLVILSNRPSLGFTPDKNKELTNAKTLDGLKKTVEAERSSFEQRHAENLKTLAAKHLFWRRDTAVEAAHYQKSTPELEEAAREAQVSLAGRALKKAGVKWCVTGQMAVSYLLKDHVTLDDGVRLAVDNVDEAVRTLEGAGFKVTRDGGANGEIKVAGLYGLDMRIATDAASRELPGRATRATVPGTSLQGLQMSKDEDVFDWKVATWRAKGPEGARDKDVADMKRMIKNNASLRERLPEELRKQLK